MNLTFKNASHFDVIELMINDTSYKIGKNKEITCMLSDSQVKFSVTPLAKTKLKINLLDFYLSKGLTQENIKTNIVCELHGTINFCENDVVFITDNKCELEECINLNSISVQSLSQDTLIEYSYKINDYSKIKRKYYFIQIVFLSGLPLLIAGIIAMIFRSDLRDISFLLLLLLLIVSGLIPSVLSLVRFNKKSKNSIVDEKLKSNLLKSKKLEDFEGFIDKYVKTEELPSFIQKLLSCIKKP